MNFTWIPFYKELAEKVVGYEKRQKELSTLIVEILQEQMGQTAADWLRDNDAHGKRVPMEAIDPFTFFASFNRYIKPGNRLGILTALKKRLQVSAAIPSGFDGIPLVQNLNSCFYAWAAERSPNDIPNLWKLASICVGHPPEQIPADLFDACVSIRQVSLPKLTMGLFWMNPDQYLNVDSIMQGFVEKNLSLSPPDRKASKDEYVQFIRKVAEAAPGKRFCELSSEAWTANQKEQPAHWVLALGKQSELWDDCHAKGIVRVGWDGMNADLGGLDETKLRDLHTKSKEGDFTGIKDFVLVMKPGDRVFIRQGMKTVIAYGEITAGTGTKGYLFNPDLKTYRHIRHAKWLKTGSWELPDGITQFSQYTLKPLDDQGRVQELLNLIGWQTAADGEDDASLVLPRFNMILYGPPGTGKTYRLKNDYFPLFTERKTKTTEQYAQELVTDLSWWETVTAAVCDFDKPKVSVSDILAHPLVIAKVGLTGIKHARAAVWGTLQMHTKEDCAFVQYSQRTPPLIFSKDADSMWTVDRTAVENEFPEMLGVPKKLRVFTPVEAEVRRYRLVTFHQSFCYEDFVEGIKPLVKADAEAEDVGKEKGDIKYEIKKGVFLELAEEARKDPSHKYALFIDEINRGNVANIFGELITFIEEDKRLDADGDLTRSPWTATLPYSRRTFGVPRNLFIIGTMNTADRSVEALDTALRRRFSFVPTYPKPELLRGEYQPAGFAVNLESLLRAINERLESLLDKDHAIGHSHFMGVKDAADPLGELKRVFADHVLPQLREFFYGNSSRIGMVLGTRFVTRRVSAAKLKKMDGEADDVEVKEVYDIVPRDHWDVEAFQSVYA